jgi:NOL1/NOP2/sun family putative RNA methylase
VALPKALLQTLPNNVDVAALENAHNLPSVTSVRYNTSKKNIPFANAIDVPWCTNAVYLNNRPFFAHDPLWHAGTYYVQEASSMLLHTALEQLLPKQNNNLKVLDLCAAPGGKSTLVANWLNNNGLLISNEVIHSRVAPLAENIMKWGRSNTWVTNNDPEAFTKLTNYFDAILVDAPCSGSGLFRKDAEYIQNWNIEQVELCSQRQQRILAAAIPALKQNGLLVYMTCSFSTNENEAIANYLVNEHGLVYEPLAINKDWNIIEADIGYRCYPHLIQGEGFYIACFRKINEEDNTIKNKNEKYTLVDEPIYENFFNKEKHTVIAQQDLLFAIPTNNLDDWQLLQKNLKLVRKGTLLGEVLKHKLVPDHALAMSIYNKYNKTIEVDANNALKFMARQAMEIPSGLDKDWYLITHNTVNLGFIKNIANRYNNYYPTNIRLRTLP